MACAAFQFVSGLRIAFSKVYVEENVWVSSSLFPFEYCHRVVRCILSSPGHFESLFSSSLSITQVHKFMSPVSSL